MKSSKQSAEAVKKIGSNYQTFITGGLEVLAKQMIDLESQHRHISNQVSGLHGSIQESGKAKQSPCPDSNLPNQTTPSLISSSTQTVNIHQKKNFKSCTQCDFLIYSKLHLKKHMKLKHGAKDKLLWVADSISSNVDFKCLSAETNMVIKSAKAFAAIPDSVGARYPDKNFLDVVEKELSENEFNVLVIGGGTVEITNLDTSVNPEANISNFKELIVTSSQQIFTLAEASLHTYPQLEKVIVLKRPPRFDPLAIDPLQLKPQLSRLGDACLFDLWCNSAFKNKIFLGDHEIPHHLDDVHHMVYGNDDHPKYDGLHMYGPQGHATFQASILNILKNAGLVKSKKKKVKPASPDDLP